MQQLILIALAIPIVTGLLTLLQRSKTTIKAINFAGSLATSTILVLIIHNITQQKVFSSEYFHLDNLSAVMLFVVALLTFTATLFSLSYMEKEVNGGHITMAMLPRYYALLNLFSFAMISVIVVGNLGLMWVAVEGTTLASALLVAFYFNRDSLEAAWKYVMICTVGICLALLGTMILYYAQVSVGAAAGQPLDWVTLKKISGSLDPAIVKIAFVFILIGYGTKAGLAPMHTWLPDAHSQAPSPVSGLLSGALLSCALYALVRNIIIVQGSIGPEFAQYMLLALGLLSIAIAIPFVLVQHDVKRLLAYSSVEHMGIITLGLGVGTPLAVYAALLHIVNHAVAKSALFYLAGVVTQEYNTKEIKQIFGIARVMPLVATLFIVGILAITGTPPFNIFITKFYIVLAMFENQQWLLGSITLLLLTGIFAGMMYYCLKMGFGAAPNGQHKFHLGATTTMAMVFSFAIIVLGGLYLPPVVNNVLVQAAEIVLGG
ncbi:hydrogenase 4 subunit F [Sporomusa sp.]|uniref:hydrogenase 4 subunit F n=1 Tax=Sporomusa sp. TaxID=2078658 RepID=UPI002C4DA40B|nr:hydrogenase 4 subunit F [Sporomusa sp.]HWR06060.1 hydrogenase 4 subunit F [Sporomusa sp.]